MGIIPPRITLAGGDIATGNSPLGIRHWRLDNILDSRIFLFQKGFTSMRLKNALPLVVAVLLLPAVVLTMAQPGSADQLKSDTALRWAPSSVGFFVSMLDLGEQVDRFQQTKAFATLRELPIVQMGWQQVQSKWNEDGGPMAEFRAFIEDPENAGLLAMAKDAYRHEIFMLGDDRLGKLIHLANDINRQSQKAQLQMIQGGGLDEDAAKDAMIDSIAEALGGMEIPNLALGFRLENPSAAYPEMQRIGGMIRAAMAEQPEAAKLIQNRKIDGSPFIQLTVTADMIPWQKAIDDEELTQEQADKLAKALGGKSLTVSLGVHDQYLLAAIGSLKNPTRLFGSKNLLIDRKELKRLRDKDGADFTSIGFVSADFLRSVSKPKEDIQQAVEMVSALLPAAQLEGDFEQSLIRDINEMADDIKSLIPDHGAALSFEYAVDGGYEGYTQTWTENYYLDGSKPLDILKHIGGNPLMVYAQRQKQDAPGKGFLGKWFKRGMHYAEQFAMQTEPEDEDVELYEAFRDALAPFGEQFARTTSEHLTPAMSDGQVAMIIDSKLEPKTQWHPMMPNADEPLGMLEFAEVCGLASSEQLETALGEYADTAQDALEKFKTVFRDNQEAIVERLQGQAKMMVPMVVQGIQLPRSMTLESDYGKLFSLAGLQQVGLDPAIAPSWGWSKDVMVMSNSPAAADRILAESAFEGGMADQADKNLATAMHLNLAGMLDTIKPWVSYGLQQAAERQDNDMITMVIPQVETIMDVIGCFAEFSSVTFVDDESLVTYYRQTLRDLE